MGTLSPAAFRFLTRHLRAWVPAYLGVIETHAAPPFYQLAAALTLRAITEERLA
jgi:TorA maturation chaperone TorD